LKTSFAEFKNTTLNKSGIFQYYEMFVDLREIRRMKYMHFLLLILLPCIVLFVPHTCTAQNYEKISYDMSDSLTGYYLAIQPKSKQIKGVIVLLTSFALPEDLLSETKLHNVACNNDLLTVYVPMRGKIYADSFAINRINNVIHDIVNRFHADTSAFVLAGYDDAGGIALRYTELAYQYPSNYPLKPKAVFGADPPVDLFGLWHWSEEQIKKNYWPGAVGDAHYYIDNMTKENGTIYNNKTRYMELSPFYRESDDAGNEQFLKTVAVRLYYDMDIEWQLKNRRNSIYDTKIADGSEFIKRLLLLNNMNAEFIAAKPGMRSNGVRNPTSLSIVDEVECIQWIKHTLGIFDPNTYVAPYVLTIPKGWGVERFSLPASFAPGMNFKGVEELRFTPGWGDSTSSDYWSYAYLWWINAGQVVDDISVQKNMQALYTGLIDRNIESRHIPADKQVATKVSLQKTATATGDDQTLHGIAGILDYMTQKPITLNLIIHIKKCSAGNTAVIIEVSPKMYSDTIWSQLDMIDQTFSCNKQ
jgi:hypothetical protein